MIVPDVAIVDRNHSATANTLVCRAQAFASCHHRPCVLKVATETCIAYENLQTIELGGGKS
jgi:hypothetical protein